MSWCVFMLFMYCVVPSYQQVGDVRISKSLIPDELQEGKNVVLRCVVRNSENYPVVAWLKNEELVTNGSEVKRNSSVYFIEQTYPEIGKLNYELNITSVSRVDNGRWTCRATPNEGNPVSENALVSVLYVPDEMYPVCQVDFGEEVVTCKTQEGNPRVQVVWSVEPNVGAKVRPRESTSNGIIYSKINLGGIGAPQVDNERIVCQSSGRMCNISKEHLYDMTTLSLSVIETENIVRFYCNVSKTLSGAILTITNDDAEVNGTLSEDVNVKILSFQNVKEIEGMNVRCMLQWGVLSHKFEEKQIELPTTAQPSVTNGNEKPGEDRDKDKEGEDSEKSKMPDESDKDPSISHQSKIWILWLLLGIFILLVIIVVMVYVYRKKKDNPV